MLGVGCSSTPDGRVLSVPGSTGAVDFLIKDITSCSVDLASCLSCKALATNVETVLAKSATRSNVVLLALHCSFKAGETNTRTTVARSPLGFTET